MGKIGKAFGGLFGLNKKAPVIDTASAAPAAPPVESSVTQDIPAESTAALLRKKSKGKASLTIPTSSASGTGGTGLNI